MRLHRWWKTMAGMLIFGLLVYYTLFYSSSSFIQSEHEHLSKLVNEQELMRADPPPVDEELDIMKGDLVLSGVPVILYDAYWSERDPRPALVFIHGGGWIAGSPELPLYIPLVSQVGAVIFSIDYRLAPDYIFPSALNDCLGVVKYLLTHSDEFNIDPHKISLMGGSAGGNLVAAVSYALSLPEERQLGYPPIYAQILISPLLQSIDFNTPSYQWNNSDVSEISREYMIRFWTMYADGRNNDMRRLMEANTLVPYNIGHYYATHTLDHNVIPDDLRPPFYAPNLYNSQEQEVWDDVKGIVMNPKFAPLMARDFSKTPQTLIYVAKKDVVRDDALFYQEQLRRAGVKVEFILDDNGYHGSFWAPDNRYVFERVAAFLGTNV